ncbi:hypothetical protein B6V75_08340 [Thioclava sp. F1Mire-8]|nr:hypothetical protein B6V75_08340 [Thioclava sp. F1Mire-8]
MLFFALPLNCGNTGTSLLRALPEELRKGLLRATSGFMETRSRADKQAKLVSTSSCKPGAGIGGLQQSRDVKFDGPGMG